MSEKRYKVYVLDRETGGTDVIEPTVTRERACEDVCYLRSDGIPAYFEEVYAIS